MRPRRPSGPAQPADERARLLDATETVYQRALASEDFAAAVRALQLRADVLGLRRAADTSALSPEDQRALMEYLSERPGRDR